MKTSLICGAALAILGVAAAPLIAQTQTTTTSSTSTSYVQTSKIVGTKVKASNGEEVGVIKDVILDRSNGCMAYTVLSTGGVGTRVTGGGKLVAVPWSVYTVSPDAGYLTVNVDRQRIYDAPVFEYSRISDTTYTTNVFSHFGVSAGVGVSYSGATSTTTGATTTATGAQTQTGGGYASPSASPGMSPSTSPGASASPSASVSASPSTSPAASASASASASTSPRSATGERNKAAASPEATTSPRHHGEQSTRSKTGESAEGAASPSERASTRKGTSEESSAATGESPSGKKSSHKKTKTEGAETTATPGGEQE
jgi:sporulation protein YlmC with PRC-barrel domain